MSILKLLFALNPKNLKLVKAAEMTPKMAQEIDSFLGKMGAVVNIGKYELTPSQAKYWRAQRKELTKYENKLKELQERNKLSKKKEGIETLPEADIIDFPVKPKPPEGEPFKDGGPVDKKDEDTVPLDPNEFDEMFRKMFSEWEWEKKKDSWKDKDYADGGRVEMVAGGITKIKKLADLAKKTKSKLGEAPKTDLKKVRARAASDKKSTEELAKSEQIPVRDDTGGVSRRDFLKGTGAVGVMAATGTGIKAARKAKKVKEGRDMQIILRKDYDEGDYAGITASITPSTRKGFEFLEEMVKQGKIRRPGSTKGGMFDTYYVDIDDFTTKGNDITVFKDLKNRDLKAEVLQREVGLDPARDIAEDFIEAVDLRSKKSVLTDDYRNYGVSSGQFEDDATEFFADIMQPKSMKQQLQDRLKKIELQNRIDAINKKYRTEKADGGVATLFEERG